MSEIAERYGCQANDASPLTRKCRLLQSWYRVEVIKQSKCGPWRATKQPKSGPPRAEASVVGSSLDDGRRAGANFISPAAFAYANEKVLEKEGNPDLTIDEHRLFNNMLSSQPMCFNLLADFRLGVLAKWPCASQVLAAIFAESGIAKVTSVEVEVIPRPTHEYIDDKTAFDALVLFEGGNGQCGMAAVETKYTDKLGGNLASKQDRKFSLAADLGLLTDAGMAWYKGHGFDQVARNLLLTESFARKRGIGNVVNYVLGPADDTETPGMVAALNARLTSACRSRMVWLPLEQVVERGLAAADPYYADHLRRFHRRYLDFSQIRHLSNP